MAERRPRGAQPSTPRSAATLTTRSNASSTPRSLSLTPGPRHAATVQQPAPAPRGSPRRSPRATRSTSPASVARNRPTDSLIRPRKREGEGEPEALRESWLMLVEARVGRLKIAGKPPIDLCSSCDSRARAAYDGPCQTLLRLKWERQWTKQIQAEIDQFRRMYLGKAAWPEVVERLHNEVVMLQDVIDTLLTPHTPSDQLPPYLQLRAVAHALEEERRQNALLEGALTELQRTSAEEDALMAEENAWLRSELERAQPDRPLPPPSLLRVTALEEELEGLRQERDALLAEQTAGVVANAARASELEQAVAVAQTNSALLEGRVRELEACLVEQRYRLSEELATAHAQLSTLPKERSSPQFRSNSSDTRSSDGAHVLPYNVLRLESEVAALKGELLMVRQGRETCQAELELERGRRTLLQVRTEEDGLELVTLREECQLLAQQLALVKEKVHAKDHHLASAPPQAAPADHQADHRQALAELEGLLLAEQQRSAALMVQVDTLAAETAAAHRRQQLWTDRIQELMHELAVKEASLVEADTRAQALQKVKEDQEAEIRRLMEAVQRQANANISRQAVRAISKAADPDDAPEPLDPASPSSSSSASSSRSSNFGVQTPRLPNAAPALDPVHLNPPVRRPSNPSRQEKQATIAPTAPNGHRGDPTPSPPAAADAVLAVSPALSLSRRSEGTLDPGTPRDCGGGSPLSDPDYVPALSAGLEAAVSTNAQCAAIMWELSDAHRRLRLNPSGPVLTRAEADAVMAAAQRLRELVTSLPVWSEPVGNDLPQRRGSLPHATRVVQAVTLYETIRRAIEGAVDQPLSHYRAPEAGLWQTVAGATEALYQLIPE